METRHANTAPHLRAPAPHPPAEKQFHETSLEAWQNKALADSGTPPAHKRFKYEDDSRSCGQDAADEVKRMLVSLPSSSLALTDHSD